MKVVVALESDSDRIKLFFREQKVEGVLDYTIERTNSFFAKYKLISDDYITFLLENDGVIEGVASLVFAPYIINQKPTTLAYALDLRVAPTREAIVTWAPLFLEAFERACEVRNCDYIFSSVERYENQAYNALIRPQRSRRRLPRYYLFWKMYFVNIHGIWPWAPTPPRALTIRSAELSDLSEISAYLNSKQQHKVIASLWAPERLLWQLANWPNFKISDLILARNHRGQIVGCLSSWDPSAIQQYRVISYKGQAETLFQGLYYGKFLGLTRPLPKPGELLNVKYLNHLQFDNPDIFSSLLQEAWIRADKNQFLSYNCFRGDYSARPPKHFISSRIPYGFYSILPPEKELPDFLRPNPWNSPPDFEIATL